MVIIMIVMIITVTVIAAAGDQSIITVGTATVVTIHARRRG